MVNSFWDLLALIGWMIGDAIAIFALVGAVLTLLLATIDAFRGRSPVRAFKRTSEWSLGAFFMAALLFASGMMSDVVTEPNTLLLGFSRSSIGLMLLLSLGSMVSSIVLSRLILGGRF